MKRGFFTVLAIILFIQVGNAQTIKTDVLVIGNGNGSIGASIQSAVSGVKTVLLMQNGEFEVSSLEKDLPSGIEQELLKRIQASKGIKGPDGVTTIDNNAVNAILKTWTDTLKNLTVIKNNPWLKLKRSGSRWNVELNDGRVVKASVLINADKAGKVSDAIAIQNTNKQWHPFNYDNNLYRTSLAAGYAIDNSPASILFLNDLLIPAQENLVNLNPQNESIAAGQAAGATGAYAAFFKTKTSEASLKTIQGELINYKLSAVPFTDISQTDTNWRSIQFIGLSGFLKADISDGKAYFKPDQYVSSAEIKQPIREYYYKAQIWFDDYKESEMTIGSTLSLISVVGNKSLENTQAEVKKKWKTVYKFKTEFDPKSRITRRVFAVLVNEYLKPFDVNIDKSGRVLR